MRVLFVVLFGAESGVASFALEFRLDHVTLHHSILGKLGHANRALQYSSRKTFYEILLHFLFRVVIQSCVQLLLLVFYER